MKLRFTLFLVILIFSLTSCNRLSKKKAEELIINHINYSLENPIIKTSPYIEIIRNTNAFGEVGEFAIIFKAGGKELNSIIPLFMDWTFKNNYLIDGEKKVYDYGNGIEIYLKCKGLTEKGEKYFNSCPYSKITMYQGHYPYRREVYFFQYGKPKVIGIRNVDDGMFEVMYMQCIDYVNSEYIEALKMYLDEIPLPKTIEHTITIKKFGNEYIF